MISLISRLNLFAAEANTGVNIPGGNCDSTCSGTGLPGNNISNGTISGLIEIALGIIGLVAVLFIVIAALQLITSGGNPESAKKARETIIYAIVGLTIVVSAETIVFLFLNHL
jgi:hypothetical protein